MRDERGTSDVTPAADHGPSETVYSVWHSWRDLLDGDGSDVRVLRMGLNLPPTSKSVPLSQALAPIVSNVSPAAGIALALPTGFLCYQLYYWLYRPRRWFGFVSPNRGWEILRRLTDEQRARLKAPFADELKLRAGLRTAVLDEAPELASILDDPFASPPSRATKRNRFLSVTAWHELVTVNGQDQPEKRKLVRELYDARWKAHFRISRVLLDLTSLVERTADIKQEYTALSDTFHALGSTRTAIILGITVGGIANVLQVGLGRSSRAWNDAINSTLTAVFIILVGLGVVIVLNNARRKAFRESTARLGFGLRAVLASHPELLDYLDGRSAPAVAGAETSS
jgi:hypothetical protein